jgi:glucose-6-phosphate 1-epimerase
VSAAELDEQFGIAGALRFEDTPGGLARAVISTGLAQAEVWPQGAHVARWTPKGQRPVLFVSSRSLFAPGKAIRGGVPIIFPWFGAREGGKPGPAHGFARVTLWTIEGTRQHGDGAVEIRLALEPGDAARGYGYDRFQLRFRVRAGATLDMELETRNDAPQPLTCEEALHSYFAVADIHQTSVSGLEGTTLIDKTDHFTRKLQPREPVRPAKETDQVHLNTTATCVVEDAVWKRRIVVEKTGSNSTVVWNPWTEKTAGMADMAPDEWQRMICVETANAADNAVTLLAGETHRMTASIRLDLLPVA